MKFKSGFLFLIVGFGLCNSVKGQFSHADSLRGSITAQRSWWDLKFYHLKVEVQPSTRTMLGSNTVVYTVLQAGQELQLDLQYPMVLEWVKLDGVTACKSTHPSPHVYFVQLPKVQLPGETHRLEVGYSGKPREARRAPWDGGLSWNKDDEGNDFIATSCQGLGASAWWPCKDHMYDEPDSMLISVTVPQGYMDVSNGQLVSEFQNDAAKTHTWHWKVKNPINNYGVNLNIAKYTHFDIKYNGVSGPLKVDFYVLPEDLEKAKTQFNQVKDMLDAFEYWFGPYPFYEDGYKLVQVPYLGMEHQSSVTYGNGFKNGYLGTDLSGTGYGANWDYIIVHESGHEWFANSITYKDIADMWVHEGFTTYAECLFVEYHYGKDAGQSYVIGQRKNIANDRPIIGRYDVNVEGSGDMYYKGANLLNTIRQVKDNDVRWRSMLLELNRVFYHKTVTSKEVEGFMCVELGIDLSKVFDQYLRDTRIPCLEYRFVKGHLCYRWNQVVPGFNMPVHIVVGKQSMRLTPTAEWQTTPHRVKGRKIQVNRNYYVTLKKVK